MGFIIKTNRKYTTIFLATAVVLAGIFTFLFISRQTNTGSQHAEVIPFVAVTQQDSIIHSEVTGTVTITNDLLELSASSGLIESKKNTREFVQTVRFGLVKKTYAFDRFRVITWARSHNIEKWIDGDTSLKLSSLESTIPRPAPESESPTSEEPSQPLRDHWLIFQIQLGVDSESGATTAYAHSEKNLFIEIK